MQQERQLEEEEREAHLVTTPNQRSTGDVQETHVLCDLLPLGELGRLDVTLDLHVFLRRTHVLAKSDDVDIVCSQICRKETSEGTASDHRFIRPLKLKDKIENRRRGQLTLQSLQQLLILLSNTQHQTRLCHELPSRRFLRNPQNLQRLSVLCSSITDRRRQAFDGLHVVGVDVETGECDLSDLGDGALEVAGEGLDEDVRSSGRHERKYSSAPKSV
jgi:hypothetical protein